jgi:hypothetical protein
MFANPFVIATVISLVARDSFAIDCNPNTVVNAKECQEYAPPLLLSFLFFS